MIWRLAWPVILTMSLEAVVGLVDMIMVGRLGSTAVAGVGVATQVLFAINTVIFAVGTGTIALVARHVGAGEVPEAGQVLGQSILVVLALTVAVATPGYWLSPWIVSAFNVEASVVDLGAQYLRIVLFAVPADAVLMIIAFGLRGAGDMRTPLAVGVVVSAVNVVANYVLIFGKLGFPAYGATGAAMGTAIAFFVGAALMFALIRRGDLVLRLNAGWQRPDWRTMWRVLDIGYPAAIEHVLMQVGFLIYFVFVAEYETSAVAAYVIGVRILGLSFLPGIGFSAAAGTIVGQNLGAGQPDQAMRGGWGATGMAAALMSVGGLIIFAAAWPIAQIFVDDPVVVRKTVSFIQVLAAAQPLMAVDFTVGGALRGAGDTRFPLYAVFIGFYACRLVCAYTVTFVLEWELFWLWCALFPDYIARSLMKARRFRSGRWQKIRI